MELQEFRKKLNQSIKANETITFFCRCAVFYSGRAEAELEEGERIIIIKSDNTILVHQPEGSVPINYMKDQSSIDLVEAEEGLLLKSHNQKYKDYLDILITKAYTYNSMKLEDGKKLTLIGSEKDMSDMIKEHPHLISKDFKPLSREEHTKHGFIDVFGHDKKGNLIIIECKRYTAGLNAVQQLRRYVEKMMDLKGLKENQIKGILAAPEIAKNAEDMLKKWKFSFVKVNPPKRHEKFNKNQRSINDF